MTKAANDLKFDSRALRERMNYLKANNIINEDENIDSSLLIDFHSKFKVDVKINGVLYASFKEASDILGIPYIKLRDSVYRSNKNTGLVL